MAIRKLTRKLVPKGVLAKSGKIWNLRNQAEAEQVKPWGAEHYIPLTPNELVDALMRHSRLGTDDQSHFSKAVIRIKEAVHLQYREHHEQLMDMYTRYDPDRDVIDQLASLPMIDETEDADYCPIEYSLSTPVVVVGRGVVESEHEFASARDSHLPEAINSPLSGRSDFKSEIRTLFSDLSESLHHANYRRLSPREIQSAVGAASHWGVRLKIRFSSFQRLEVHGRGDIVVRRKRRSWRRFFREEEVDVPIYQRLVVIFWPKEVQSFSIPLDPKRMHIRMFKNVPKTDIDMMLPGSQVRLSWMDRGKIGLPTLWGIVMMSNRLARSVWILALFGTLKFLSSFFLIIAVVVATIFYGIKSVFSYSTAKRRYELNVAQNLYYQNLDNNLGALLRIEEEAEQQEIAESILAYFVLWQSEVPLSTQQLDATAEKIFLAMTGLEIDFDVQDALRDLSGFSIVKFDGHGWTLSETLA